MPVLPAWSEKISTLYMQNLGVSKLGKELTFYLMKALSAAGDHPFTNMLDKGSSSLRLSSAWLGSCPPQGL